MTVTISIHQFLQDMPVQAVIDVRSPGEFTQGHIPSAVNVPLFDDEERARVGKEYKSAGRDSAVLLGLEIAGPKMRGLVEAVRNAAGQKPILLHCWRGGMRSASVGWLLSQAGIAARILEGGYKSFRQQAQVAFAADRKILVLSGMTGAGKTDTLYELAVCGQQIVDLEGLAHHRGSSFGAIGLPSQPTCEQFENNLFLELDRLDDTRPVWLEDESLAIGKVRVPDALWWQMRRSPAIFLEVDRRTRAKNLVKEYGALDRDLLIEAAQRLQKKLGGLRTQQAMDLIVAGNDETAAYELLDYYDKSYQYAAKKRPRDEVHRLSGDLSAQRIIEFGRSLDSVSV